jgi:hypothetical protein
MSNPNNDREEQDEPEGGRHLDGVGVLQMILVVIVDVVVSDVIGVIIAVVVAIEARFGKDKLLHHDGVQVL